MYRVIAKVSRASVVALAFLMIGCSSVSDAARQLVGRPVPDGRLMLLSGQDIALQGKRGTNLAILFWATWCPHSRSQIELFEELARKYQFRKDLEFYAISIDKNSDLDGVRQRIESQNLKTVTHVFSGNDVLDETFLSLQGSSIPYAVFIDARGVVRLVDIGAGSLEDLLASRFGR